MAGPLVPLLMLGGRILLGQAARQSARTVAGQAARQTVRKSTTAAAKKATARKTTTSAAKKTTSKKTTAKKTTAKKTTAKKTTTARRPAQRDVLTKGEQAQLRAERARKTALARGNKGQAAKQADKNRALGATQTARARAANSARRRQRYNKLRNAAVSTGATSFAYEAAAYRYNTRPKPPTKVQPIRVKRSNAPTGYEINYDPNRKKFK